MSDVIDSLQDEELQAFEREQELAELEHQVQEQEQGLIDMERSYAKRVKALVNLVSYVSEQERSLLVRAEAIGSAARELVEETIESVDESVVLDELDFGMEDMRQTMLERRLDLVDVRTGLAEDREALYGERADKLENAESRIVELEESLLAREMEIAGVLRKLITGAADFGDDEQLGMADTVAEIPAATRTVRETDSIGREALKVESGTARVRKTTDDVGGSTDATVIDQEAPVVEADDAEREAAEREAAEAAERAEREAAEAAERAEREAADAKREAADAKRKAADAKRKAADAKRKAAEAEARQTVEEAAVSEPEAAAGGSKVRFNLEANLNSETGHTFFKYEDDGEDDFPGLFIATNNLLKEDREVRIALDLDDASIQLKGVVDWRRLEPDEEGPAGMGIEITWLGPGGPEALGVWLAEHPPITV